MIGGSDFRNSLNTIPGVGASSSNGLKISELDYGYSANGLEEYKIAIKQKMLQDAANVIDDQKENVKSAFDKGWAGESREKFDALFDQKCEELKQALDDEYQDLESRLNELSWNFVNQDKKMIIE